MPLFFSILDNRLGILRINGVQDVEEVLARRCLALRIFVREELDELSIFLELRI